MLRKYWIAVLVCCTFSQQIPAFRCSNIPIKNGDSKDDVYDACGEPDYVSARTEIRHDRQYTISYTQYGFSNNSHFPINSVTVGETSTSTTEVEVEKWTYHFRRGGIPKRQLWCLRTTN